MPVVASQELDAGSFGYGLLAGALGLGSVLGILVMPRLRGRLSPEQIVVASSLLWGGGVVAFAAASNVALGVLCVLVVGAAQMATMNTYWSRYLLELPDWLRGRGTSLSMLVVWFGMSLGSSVWSSVAAASSVATALTVVAVCHVGMALVGRTMLEMVDATN